MMLLLVFIIGYLAITLEHPLRLNKAATALLTGVLCWTVYVSSGVNPAPADSLTHHLSEIAGILFFLLGAMTIVELIDAHDGFDIITSRITTVSRRRLLIIVGILAFFLSAVLDNLTTAIVMISLIRKLVSDEKDRWYYGGIIIIAANAGGAWSPIGDVTTTMLWVGGQITSSNIVAKLILPSLVSLAVPLTFMAWKMKGNFTRPDKSNEEKNNGSSSMEKSIVFFTGVIVLFFVPVFKSTTDLPPFMGILLGLGVLWLVTELIHKSKNDEHKSSLSVAGALQRIDTPSVLFFLGILLAISALDSAGHLHNLSAWMDSKFHNVSVITMLIGLASAVVDNVPLVAAAQGMYPTTVFATDHCFWEFLAYCAGTGGSILIIGSAAGVAVMG
ncbi:MAG TPA: sodium:proton antiporter NhaD, partial [Bacteroidia bacterium]|nr:sodium:proton antiporter NhaD [Bacteroidia bacterium]